MKKIIALILAVVLTVSVFSCLPASAVTPNKKAVNYFPDGDFEEEALGQKFYHCYDGSWGGGWASGISGEWVKGYIANDNAFSGSQALWSAHRNNSLEKILDVEPNTNYTLYFYYYCNQFNQTIEGSSYTVSQKLSRVCVCDETATYNGNGGNISVTPFAIKYYDGYSGTASKTATQFNKWTKATITFNSGSRTKVKFFTVYHDFINSEDIADNQFTHKQVGYDDFQLYKTEDVNAGLTNGDVDPGITYGGASISTNGAVALRFKTSVNQDIIKTTYGSGYTVQEIGATVIKSEYLGDKELVEDGEYSYGGKVRTPVTAKIWEKTNVASNKFVSGKNYEATLLNISSANYSKRYSYRPYVKIKTGTNTWKTLYGKTVEASLSEVAMMAANSKVAETGAFLETATTRQMLDDRYIGKLSAESLYVANGSPYYNTDNFCMNWTVYHCTAYIDSSTTSGRNYTEKQAQDEFDRLQYCGIENVRTMFRSYWATGEYNDTLRNNSSMFNNYNYNFKGWDFTSDRMQAFLRAAKELQKRGITIGLAIAWLLPWFYLDAPNEWYQECPYLHGNGDDYYGESAGENFSGMTAQEIRMRKAGLRLGEFVSQALKYFRSQGCTNIKYLFLCTEPPYKLNDDVRYVTAWPAYVSLAEGLHDNLVKNGERSTVKIIGPDQASPNPGDEDTTLLKYVLQNIKDQEIFDFHSIHGTPMFNTEVGALHFNDSTWSFCDQYMGACRSIMDKYCTSDAGFISDEWGLTSFNKSTYDCGALATMSAVGLICSHKYKYSGISYWQIFDQLWPETTSDNITTGGEFERGVHRTGTTNAIVESYVPYATYYGVSLMTRYTKGCHNVIQTEFKHSDTLYYTAVEGSDGTMTIIVCNTGKNPQYFSLDFTKSLGGKTLNRHLFDYTSVYPTAEAKLAGIDKSFKVTNTLCDVIPTEGICVYTTRND